MAENLPPPENRPEPRPMVDRIKDFVPFLTSMLMIAGISFTYYTYFYDVRNTPQLLFEKNITKIDETENFYIIKISVFVKNLSKRKVDIVSNQMKLYGLRCKLNYDSMAYNDERFKEEMLSRYDTIQRTHQLHTLNLNKYLDCGSHEFIGFYQPIHNDSYLLPEESLSGEITAAVQKIYDMAGLEIVIWYAKDDEGLLPVFERDINGDVNYNVYVLEGDGKDSTKKHQISILDDEDKSVREKKEIMLTALSTTYWLGSDNAIKNLNKKPE